MGGWSSLCLPAVRDWVRVDAWAGAASGGSFRAAAPVAVSGIGLLLRGGRVGCGNIPDNAYAQGGQELGVSAGACRAGSLASESPNAQKSLYNFTISEPFRNNSSIFITYKR